MNVLTVEQRAKTAVDSTQLYTDMHSECPSVRGTAAKAIEFKIDCFCQCLSFCPTRQAHKAAGLNNFRVTSLFEVPDYTEVLYSAMYANTYAKVL